MFFKKRILTEANMMIDDYLARARAFYVQEKADFATSLPQLVGNLLSPQKMSELGQMSGISRQLKGLEKELISDGIEGATGLPGIGGMAAKYIQKYPILMNILPGLVQQFTQKQQSSRENKTSAW